MRPPPRTTAAAIVLAFILPWAGCKSDAFALKVQYERLLTDARPLAKAEGCASAADCAAVPVGVKACGGPREYWTYCRTSTDEAALRARLDEERRLEQAYNEATHAVSDCSFALPPDNFVIVAGACRPEPQP